MVGEIFSDKDRVFIPRSLVIKLSMILLVPALFHLRLVVGYYCQDSFPHKPVLGLIVIGKVMKETVALIAIDVERKL